jgi:hypothetical protein
MSFRDDKVYNLDTCGYVLAGIPSLYSKYTIDEDFPFKQNIKLMGQNTIGKGLYSYGSELINLSKRKTKPKINDYNKKINKYIKQIKRKRLDFTPNMKFFLDSGGFQAIGGYLNKEQMKDFAHQYIDFLIEYKDDYDHAFILDLPAFDSQLKSTKDIYDINKYSYQLFHDLPLDIQHKLIYVYHFGLPRVNDIWYRFFQEGVADGIETDYYSIGGLVGRRPSDTNLPYINYALPLYNTLKYNIDKGRKYMKFHILGVGTYYLGVFFAFLKKLLKDKYDFVLDPTFDATSPIKHLGQMKVYQVFNDYNLLDTAESFEELMQIKLRTVSISSMYDQTIERFGEYDKMDNSRNKIIESICWMDKYSQTESGTIIEPITIDKIYDDEHKYKKESYLPMMMYDCFIYDILSTLACRILDKSGLDFSKLDDYNVNKEVSNLLYKILDNLTPNKSLELYQRKIMKSMELFMNLDSPDKANNIINHYLNVDETSNNDTRENQSILTF